MLGVYDWPRFSLFNRLSVEGREHLAKLPRTGVLFVSNHLTYYIDVLGIHHGFIGGRCTPFDGFRANLNVGFIAAVETLNERGLIPKIFNFCGAVLVRRTWRDGDKDVKRSVDPGDLDRIGAALRRGWLITFPQGTTTPGAPVRKGTAHIIRQFRPVVVPVVLSGFDKAFRKKGLGRIARGIDLKVRFKAPLAIAPNETVENIVATIADAIAQPA